MKRETLLHNVEIIVERINEVDLPAQIKQIYVFGSFIRSKEKPHDLDIVMISDWDQAKKNRWQKFIDNFMRFVGNVKSVLLVESFSSIKKTLRKIGKN